MRREPAAQGAGPVGSVLVIDDHPLYSDALAMALEHVFPACAISTVTTLRAGVEKLDGGVLPDMILLDLRLPDVSGISGFQSLRARVPDVPIVVISALTSVEVVHALMREGAAGFIPKDVSAKALHAALHEVGRGRRYLPRSFTDPISPPPREQSAHQICDKIADLTPQQARIMKLICAGKPNKQIAYEMSLAEATVKAHITALLRRLGVQNRTQAAVLVEGANLEMAAGISDADARSFLSQ